MAEAERREAIRRTLLNRTGNLRRARAEQMKAIFNERVDELAARGGQEYSDLYHIIVPRSEIIRLVPPTEQEMEEE